MPSKTSFKVRISSTWRNEIVTFLQPELDSSRLSMPRNSSITPKLPASIVFTRAKSRCITLASACANMAPRNTSKTHHSQFFPEAPLQCPQFRCVYFQHNFSLTLGVTQPPLTHPRLVIYRRSVVASLFLTGQALLLWIMLQLELLPESYYSPHVSRRTLPRLSIF